MAGNPRHGRPYRRLVDWLRSQRLPCWLFGHPVGYDLDARHPLTVSRPKNTSGLVILPRRWVVEGQFAWIMRALRQARDYERLIQHSESLITWAAITLMTRRITRRSSRRKGQLVSLDTQRD